MANMLLSEDKCSAGGISLRLYQRDASHLHVYRPKKIYPEFIVTNFAYRDAMLSAIRCTCVIASFKSRPSGCHASRLHPAWRMTNTHSGVIWHLRGRSKRAFTTYRYARPSAHLRVCASKHELPTTIAARIVRSTTVNWREAFECAR